MNIKIKEVKGGKDLKTFIYLPEKIHKGHEKWFIPYILMKDKKFLFCCGSWDRVIITIFSFNHRLEK